jgi:acetylornithine deacetylase/succinyl-diaminopimelate desuccinylase-like protein
MADGVNRARLLSLAQELVEIPSPTGDTAAVARAFARQLERSGMDVQLLTNDFPSTPTVIGRLRGGDPGPTVVLNGHLDTIPIDHAPPRLQGDRLYGRGAADMKGAMASAAEAARLLASTRPFRGELAVVAIGLHEAPDGRAEDLHRLLDKRGFSADYAIVCELAAHELVVAHMGQATASINISRPGGATHELQTPPGTPHPLHAAARVIDAIGKRNEELALVEHPWVGRETYFVGEVHGGDFFNRYPAACRLSGTRRWAPGRVFSEVDDEYRSLIAKVADDTGCAIDLDLRIVRDAYAIDEEHPLAEALSAAYEDVVGARLEPVGIKVVADAAIFQQYGIPAVYHGPRGVGAHADVEYVDLDELVRATRVYAATFARLSCL